MVKNVKLRLKRVMLTLAEASACGLLRKLRRFTPSLNSSLSLRMTHNMFGMTVDYAWSSKSIFA